MVQIQTLSSIILIAFLITGCGLTSRTMQQPGSTAGTASSVQVETDSIEKEEVPPPSKAVSSANNAQTSLMQAYREWKGTPYVLGGASQDGVDCSRFVNIVFDEYFEIELPKNTRAQLNAGDEIRRAAIRTGDLVFFRTGRKTLHVGIAVNRGEFLHASTSNGVMISKLGNSYWRERFLAARRLF